MFNEDIRYIKPDELKKAIISRYNNLGYDDEDILVQHRKKQLSEIDDLTELLKFTREITEGFDLAQIGYKLGFEDSEYFIRDVDEFINR